MSANVDAACGVSGDSYRALDVLICITIRGWLHLAPCAFRRIVNTEVSRQTRWSAQLGGPILTTTTKEFLEIPTSTPRDAARHQGDIGTVVSAARHALGLTQSEFGALIGCTQALVSKYERARADPPAALVIRCLRVLLDPLWGPDWLDQALATHTARIARRGPAAAAAGGADALAQRSEAA